MKTRTTFTNTTQALAQYDDEAPIREKLWDDAKNSADIDAAEQIEIAALDHVRDAFYLDTANINSKESCTSLPLHFMRRMTQKSND